MAKSRDTTQRQWTTLRMIPREPQQLSTRQVWEKLQAQAYDVDIRTVQRDLSTLSVQFGFSSDDRKGPEGSVWFWPLGAANLDVPGLEPTTAIALLLSRQHLDPLLPSTTLSLLKPYFDRAENVMATHHGNSLATWRKKVRVLIRGPHLGLPSTRPEIQSAIYEALLSSRLVKATYRRRGANEAKEMDLSPLGLVVKDGLTYLVALAWNYDNPTHFALHRFEVVEVMETRARSLAGFELYSYIEKTSTFSYPESPAPIPLKLAVAQNVADHLAERPLGIDQEISTRKDGRCDISVTVGDTSELRWWILGFGSQVEVLGPSSLRKEFVKTVREMTGQYLERRKAG